MSEMIDLLALAIWRQREMTFPPRVRRLTPDALDRQSGAWQACLDEALYLVEYDHRTAASLVCTANTPYPGPASRGAA